MTDALRDFFVQRSEKSGFTRLESLGDEVRRENEDVTRLAVDGNFRPVLVGRNGPLQADRVDERLAEREADRIDVHVGSSRSASGCSSHSVSHAAKTSSRSGGSGKGASSSSV